MVGFELMYQKSTWSRGIEDLHYMNKKPVWQPWWEFPVIIWPWQEPNKFKGILTGGNSPCWCCRTFPPSLNSSYLIPAKVVRKPRGSSLFDKIFQQHLYYLPTLPWTFTDQSDTGVVHSYLHEHINLRSKGKGHTKVLHGIRYISTYAPGLSSCGPLWQKISRWPPLLMAVSLNQIYMHHLHVGVMLKIVVSYVFIVPHSVLVILYLCWNQTHLVPKQLLMNRKWCTLSKHFPSWLQLTIQT